MSDRFSGQIWIGGKASRKAAVRRAESTVVALIGEINSSGVSHAWGDAPIECSRVFENELLTFLDGESHNLEMVDIHPPQVVKGLCERIIYVMP